MRGAGLGLGGDSGPLHLASLCGLPGVALFGPTSARQWGRPPDHPARPLPSPPCPLLEDPLIMLLFYEFWTHRMEWHMSRVRYNCLRHLIPITSAITAQVVPVKFS